MKANFPKTSGYVYARTYPGDVYLPPPPPDLIRFADSENEQQVGDVVPPLSHIGWIV